MFLQLNEFTLYHKVALHSITLYYISKSTPKLNTPYTAKTIAGGRWRAGGGGGGGGAVGEGGREGRVGGERERVRNCIRGCNSSSVSDS